MYELENDDEIEIGLFGENVNLQNVVKTEGGGYHGLQENSTADL